MSLKTYHWYTESGEPKHTIIGSNGKERPTNIRDARKHGWLASATTILKILSKELDYYKAEQVINATRSNPQKPGEDMRSYVSRIVTASEQHMMDAADMGTRIHKAIENHFLGEEYDLSMVPYVQAVDDWCKSEGVVFDEHEKTVVNLSHRFAGTLDGKIKSHRGIGIIDIKTKSFGPDDTFAPYPEHPLQVSAYLHTEFPELEAAALGAGCCNLYVSRNNPGLVRAFWYTPEEMQKSWAAFVHLLQFWKIQKGFN